MNTNKGGKLVGVDNELPNALIPYALGFSFQLNPKYAPTFIAELQQSCI